MPKKFRQPKLSQDERDAVLEAKREAARKLKREQEEKRRVRKELVDMLTPRQVCTYLRLFCE